MSEIRLRAITQIGKISRELEKAERKRDEHGHLLPATRNQVSKEQQLEAAGISTSTANEYEQLAASRQRKGGSSGGVVVSGLATTLSQRLAEHLASPPDCFF